MADPLDQIARICDEQPHDALSQIAAVLGMDLAEKKRDELRALWLEWLDGMYDSADLLRRVKLAVHGPLRKPGNAGVQEPAAPSDTARLNVVLDTFGKREDNMPLTPAERGLIVAFTDRGSYTKGMKLSAIDDAVRAAAGVQEDGKC
jgi:hypothetical protein